MEKDKNAFIKILIVLVIASLALLAIVYVMLQSKNQISNQEELLSIPDNNVPLVEDEIILENNTEIEDNTTVLPAFADIDNYQFYTTATGPVNCKYVNNEFLDLENELNVAQTGYLNYFYNGFVLTAIENKYDWTKDDFMEIMQDSVCGSSIFYGTIADGQYLLFGKCSGVASLGTNKNDYSTLVGSCTAAANDVYDYFASATVGSSLIEKTW